MLARLLALALMFVGCPVQAAEIVVKDGIISVSGLLERADIDKFKKAARQIVLPTTVVLNGDGGNAAASLLIGEEIQRRGFATLVEKQATCASACAFAWIAGNPRLMEPGAKIGFHSVFVMHNGKPEVSAVANALVGSYLTTIGVPPPAIVFATEAQPENMNWLTVEKASSLGIKVHEMIRQ